MGSRDVCDGRMFARVHRVPLHKLGRRRVGLQRVDVYGGGFCPKKSDGLCKWTDFLRLILSFGRKNAKIRSKNGLILIKNCQKYAKCTRRCGKNIKNSIKVTKK